MYFSDSSDINGLIHHEKDEDLLRNKFFASFLAIFVIFVALVAVISYLQVDIG